MNEKENKPVSLGSDGGIGHMTFNDTKCPKCGSEPEDHELRNYDPVWRDGDIYCKKCGTRVRTYDAG
jgi:hypothetical protein